MCSGGAAPNTEGSTSSSLQTPEATSGGRGEAPRSGSGVRRARRCAAALLSYCCHNYTHPTLKYTLRPAGAASNKEQLGSRKAAILCPGSKGGGASLSRCHMETAGHVFVCRPGETAAGAKRRAAAVGCRLLLAQGSETLMQRPD